MTQSLIIKDGNGATKNLTVESSSYGYVPVHSISSSEGSGSYVTASAAYPVYVTGNVSISQPVNVDVVVGDNIAVTSSLAAPLYVSSSDNSPLLVTGALTVNTASLMTVTASSTNPVYVTGSTTVAGTITAINPVVTSISLDKINTGALSWGGASQGAFNMAPYDSTRKGLIVFNPGPADLYVALYTGGGGTTFGFTMDTTASAPSYYSFIIYPSGTFIADSTNVNGGYGGYFISGSVSTGVFITKNS